MGAWVADALPVALFALAANRSAGLLLSAWVQLLLHCVNRIVNRPALSRNLLLIIILQAARLAASQLVAPLVDDPTAPIQRVEDHSCTKRA